MSAKETYDPQKPLKNSKWEQFVQNVFEQERKTTSNHRVNNYAEAYTNAGYKAVGVVASAAASRLLKNVNVAARLEFLKSKVANDKILSKERACELLTEHALANLTDYIQKTEHGYSTLVFSADIPNARAMKKIKTKTDYNEKTGEERVTFDEFTLNDPVRAIQALADILGWKKIEEKKCDALEQLVALASESIVSVPG